MVPQSKTWILKFFNFFGHVPALPWGSESTELIKVWKIPQSLNLNIIYWDFTDALPYTSAIVKKIKIQNFLILNIYFGAPKSLTH